MLNSQTNLKDLNTAIIEPTKKPSKSYYRWNLSVKDGVAFVSD